MQPQKVQIPERDQENIMLHSRLRPRLRGHNYIDRWLPHNYELETSSYCTAMV